MNMEKWMAEYCCRMNAAFGDRIRFIGLQGSRARGESNENSDIDVVCILDALTPDDIGRYRNALEGIEKRELVCGFLSGWNELMHWEASDLFQFYYDTVPFAGSLDALKDRIDSAAVECAVRIGVGNIYHGCVHNMVHERNAEVLSSLYKSAAFTLQALYFLRSGGEYVRRMNDLQALLNGGDARVLQTAMDLKEGTPVEFESMSGEIFCWAQSLLKRQGCARCVPSGHKQTHH